MSRHLIKITCGHNLGLNTANDMDIGLAALRLEPLNQRVVKDAPKSKALLHLAFSGGSEDLLVQGKAQEKLLQ